jgi:hypothetical protein
MLLSGFGDFLPGSCLPSGKQVFLELRNSSSSNNSKQVPDTSGWEALGKNKWQSFLEAFLSRSLKDQAVQAHLGEIQPTCCNDPMNPQPNADITSDRYGAILGRLANVCFDG